MRASVVAVGGVVLVLAVASAAAAKRAAFLMPDADVVFGSVDAHRRVPDFLWDDANKKLKTRSLMVAEHGDPSEIALRRTGPDDTLAGTALAQLEPNRTIGLVYAQALGANLDYEGERADGSSCLGRSAEIAMQAAGEQASSSRPGRLAFRTTRAGECETREVLALESDGAMNWSGQPTHAAVGLPRPCAMVRIRFFDGTRERDGFVPVACS